MKRVFIIHGWGGYPEEGWFPWLKKELEEKNFKVKSLYMPNSRNPRLKEWLDYLNKSVTNPDKDTYFVGHSLGCITIVRYLENLPKNVKVGGCVFVAGFSFLGDEEIKEFYKKDFDINKIKKHCNIFVNIYSDNDKDVPIEKSEEFANLLGAKKILEKGKGHFSGEDEIKKLSIVLNSLLEIIKQ